MYVSIVLQAPNIPETKALVSLCPDRIGHGTCIHPDNGGDQELADSILQAKIPLGNI